jgi:hypothetical protein
MMRILIPFVAALGLSLGVSTGVVMMRAPTVAPMTAADSAKADSLKTDSAKAKSDSARAVASGDSAHGANADSVKGDSAHVDSTAHGTEGAAASVAANVPAGATKGVEKGVPAASAAHAVPASAPVKNAANAARTDSTQKVLAKVFASMQAPNAAHILQQMDDSDVQLILASLSPKQQAAILGQFPAQRAATIARATLRGEGSDQ